MTDSVLCEQDGAVATITLNRPEARNALTAESKTALLAALRRCGSDAGVRAVILTGAGRAFCGGQDLREHASWRRARPRRKPCGITTIQSLRPSPRCRSRSSPR